MILNLRYVIAIALFCVNYGFSGDKYDPFGMLEFRNKYRRIAFNTEPDSENKINDELWGLTDKNKAIFEYTTEIDESLFDDTEALFKYAENQKTELLLKTIMGSVITDKKYTFDESGFPSISRLDPLFSYYTLVTEASELSRNLLAKIRKNGYTPISISDLDYAGTKYSNLFTCCGVPRYLFARWFNEVFKEHEPGFRMQNPDLSIYSYDPTEQLIRPSTRVRFDPRCNELSLCSHADEFEILEEEIEACYSVRPGVPFRHFKPKSASEGNNIGNPYTGALGRRFGDPDEEGISSNQKESIETSIRNHLTIRKSNYFACFALKESCYLETDPGEEVAALSAEIILALDHMWENTKSKRF